MFGIALGNAYPNLQAPQGYAPAAAGAQAPANSASSHTVANPTSSVAPQPSASYRAPSFVAVPAIAIAFVPAFGLPIAAAQAVPGYGAANYGGAGANGAGAVGGLDAGHVTSNPTSSLSSGNAQGPAAQAGFGGYGAGFAGAVGGYALAVPVVAMPVFFAFGSPVFAAPTAPSPTPTPTPPATPAVDDVPAVVDDSVDVPLDDTPPVVDVPVTPNASDDANDADAQLPISRYAIDEFARVRARSVERSVESNLTLSLTTKDGDSISLDFSQLDVLSKKKVIGQLADGTSIRDFSRERSTERAVNIDITGDLSADEKAAVDALIDDVIDVAGRFLRGDTAGALNKLESLNFNTEQLSEFSLKMSVNKKVDIDKMFLGDDSALQSLAIKDGEVGAALEFFASEQKSLIESARQVFNDESAVKLVKSALPFLLASPLEQLASEVGDFEPAADAADETDGNDQVDSEQPAT